MIDHTLLKPAAVVVLAGATAAALTVGQSAFAVGPAAARARASRAGPRRPGRPAPPGPARDRARWSRSVPARLGWVSSARSPGSPQACC